jgi:hypothetical protein
MPSISLLSLSITGSAVGSTVTLDVSYSAKFSALEQFLADHGLGFAEGIQIIGDDPGEASDLVLHTFPSQMIALTPGQLLVTRSRQITVPRSSLNEDPGRAPSPGRFPPGLPNVDELFARVEILYAGLSSGPSRADSPVKSITVV